MIAEERRKVRVLEWQRDFLAHAGKFAALRGGVGSGKSRVCALWMLGRMCRYPLGQHYVVGSDYPQLKRGFLPTFRSMLEDAGISYTYKSTDGTFYLDEYDATLMCLSAELQERIRSLEIDTVLVEEPQSWFDGRSEAEEVFKTIVGRMRGSPMANAAYPDIQPQMRMSFNPPPKSHWLFHVIEEVWKAAGWPCEQVSARDNLLLGNGDRAKREEYIRTLESTYAKDRWPAEIDGNWSNLGGAVYRYFDVAKHDVDPPAPLPARSLDDNRMIVWSHDFNVRKMCSVIGQVWLQPTILKRMQRQEWAPPREVFGPQVDDWQTRLIYIYDEICLRDSGTPDVVAEFLRRYGDQARRAGVLLCGDASGSNRSQTQSAQQAALSNWGIIIQGLQAAGVHVETAIPFANPSVLDRVNATNLQFSDPNGIGIVIDTATCRELVTDLQGVQWDQKGNDIDKRDPERTHMTDALGYMIWADRERANMKMRVFSGPVEIDLM